MVAGLRHDLAPLVLMGHGGGAHKKHPAMAGRAHLLVAGLRLPCRRPQRARSWRPAAYRARRAGDRRAAQGARRKAQAAGEPEGPIVVRYSGRLAEFAVPEWQAILDALQELPEIGADGPVGYVGIGPGTAIGVPLVAVEPRITAAVFGLMWPDALVETAKQITIPIECDLQWDNERILREAGHSSIHSRARAGSVVMGHGAWGMGHGAWGTASTERSARGQRTVIAARHNARSASR
ncbi:hypothetical protein ACWD9X_42960 [Streptomyces sp. NPDC005075]